MSCVYPRTGCGCGGGVEVADAQKLQHPTYTYSKCTLTLLSSRLSKGPGGSSRHRNSLTGRLSRTINDVRLECLCLENRSAHTDISYLFSYACIFHIALMQPTQTKSYGKVCLQY